MDGAQRLRYMRSLMNVIYSRELMQQEHEKRESISNIEF